MFELDVGNEPTFSDYETEVLPLNESSIDEGFQLSRSGVIALKQSFVAIYYP